MWDASKSLIIHIPCISVLFAFLHCLHSLDLMLAGRRCHTNSQSHSLLPVNINAAKRFGQAAHIRWAWRHIFVCADSDRVFHGKLLESLPSIFFFFMMQ